jgi:choline monooxygenase
MRGYRTEVFERFSIQTAPPAAPASTGDGRIAFDASARIGPGALYAWIYPSFMLNRYGPCLDTNYVVPLGPDRCEVRYEFFFEEGAGSAEEFVAESIEQSAVTQREDIAICESVQLGLSSSGYDRGRYAPQVEIGEHHFHRLLAESYRQALTASPASAPLRAPAR